MRMFRVLFVASAGWSLMTATVVAQSDTQGWTALAVSGPAVKDERFLLWFDGHARFRDDISALGVSILRPGIGYRINNNLDLWLGYARVTSHQPGPDIGENRIWQQATYPLGDLFGGTLSGRTRIEQRFRESGDDTGHRVRQFFRWSRPIGDGEFSWVVANETFIALNNADWGQADGYDQNRAFFGFAWNAAPNLRIETGYLNNHLSNGPADSQTNHNFSIAFFANLN